MRKINFESVGRPAKPQLIQPVTPAFRLRIYPLLPLLISLPLSPSFYPLITASSAQTATRRSVQDRVSSRRVAFHPISTKHGVSHIALSDASLSIEVPSKHSRPCEEHADMLCVDSSCPAPPTMTLAQDDPSIRERRAERPLRRSSTPQLGSRHCSSSELVAPGAPTS